MIVGYKRVSTTAEVWAVIRASHPDLIVFSSYSAPDGDGFGDPSECKMMTEYGFPLSDLPTIGAETTWEKDPEKEHKRINERTLYWICVGITQD